MLQLADEDPQLVRRLPVPVGVLPAGLVLGLGGFPVLPRGIRGDLGVPVGACDDAGLS